MGTANMCHSDLEVWWAYTWSWRTSQLAAFDLFGGVINITIIGAESSDNYDT